jgi:predicted glycosyltransferase involved in capsule biosynthesis
MYNSKRYDKMLSKGEDIKMELSVLIPYRYSELREKQLEYQLHRFRKYLPEAEIIVCREHLGIDYGDNKEWSEFNKSRLLNKGAKRASKEVLLICDVDMLIPIENIKKGIKEAYESSIVFPYNKVDFVSEVETVKIYLSVDDVPEYKSTMLREKNKLDTHGTYMITRDNYFKVGGHEERFVSWGGEDGSFISAAVTLIDQPYLRMLGTAIHMYHPKPKEIRVFSTQARELYTRYLEARYDKERMLGLLMERQYFK